MKQAELKMKQLVVGQWIAAEGGASYSVIGLSVDGKVYRYDAGSGGWVAWGMKEVPAKARR